MRRVEVREGEDLLKCVEYEKKVKNIARHLFTYFFGTKYLEKWLLHQRNVFIVSITIEINT